jgi:hypothetical protein
VTRALADWKKGMRLGGNALPNASLAIGSTTSRQGQNRNEPPPHSLAHASAHEGGGANSLHNLLGFGGMLELDEVRVCGASTLPRQPVAACASFARERDVKNFGSWLHDSRWVSRAFR